MLHWASRLARPSLASAAATPLTTSVVRLGAVGDVVLLHFNTCITQGRRGVLEQHLLLRRRHLPEQVAGLLVVIVVHVVIPVCGVAAEVAIGAHRAIAMIALERAL